MERLMRLAMLALLPLAVITSVMSCDGDEPTGGDTAGAYSGLVIDSVTTLPIDSAMVSLTDTSGVLVYTDSTGYFQGASWAGTVTIYVRKEGYETAWKVRVLGVDATDLLFQLAPLNNE